MELTKTIPIKTDIALDSTSGLTTLRNTPFISNGGSISAVGGEIILSSNVSTASVARLSTVQRIAPTPGWDTFAHIGIRMPSVPTGSQIALWGIYDDVEGFGFGMDATSLFTFTKSNSTYSFVRRGNWIIDKLDGTGVSKLNITPLSAGVVFQFRSTWYGGVEYGVFRPEGGMEQANAHRIRNTAPMFLKPFLPIRAEVQNNNSSTNNLMLALSIRKACQVSDDKPSVRPVCNSLRNQSINNGADTMVMSLRRKTTTTVPVTLDSLEILTDQPMEIIIRNGGDVNGVTWTDPNGIAVGESLCQVQTGAISNSVIIDRALVAAGRSTYSFSPDFIPPTNSDPVSVYATPIGSGNATASFNLRWKEQW